MGTTLSTLSPNPGANQRKKRLGRGRGSHRGKTSTKGQKGQKARTGHHGMPAGFEGGQMPMDRRLPKRGFKNPFRVEVAAINVGMLSRRFDGEVDIDALRAAGLVPTGAQVVKILGEGALDKPLVVKAHRFSKMAAEKIRAAGGTVEVIEIGKGGQNDGGEAVES
jgi:large subunit ribosomal protein L15